jgi:hypothetical protein
MQMFPDAVHVGRQLLVGKVFIDERKAQQSLPRIN